MSRILGPGPYKTLTTHDGIDVPFYIVRFDKKGLLQSPETAKEIISRAHKFSDVFFFSHGWNNDWTWANKRYQDFFDEYSKLRQAHDLAMPAGYKPMMVGVFWPSTALVFGKSERGPDFMDMGPTEADDDYPEDRFLQDLAEVADILEEEDRSALYSLAQTNGLGRQQALQLAELMTKVVSDSEGEIDHVETVAPQALLDSWIEASESGAGSPGHGGAQIKDTRIQDGFFKVLDPRRIIRLLTVAIMKDRAGVVGHAGVGGVLQQLLDNSAARIHLVGHSYGAKVMLSALKSTQPHSRKVHSALLLQPAISHLAFADRLPGKTGQGGYHGLQERVHAPILSTFSSHDFALHTLFHHALRRKADLGETKIDALARDPSPSPYAALGGYGPRHSGEQLIPIKTAPDPYALDGNNRIYGLNGSDGKKIGGHGDIINPYTSWALHSLVRYGMQQS